MKRMLIIAGVAAFLSMSCLVGFAGVRNGGTKGEAFAVVKKTIEYIKANNNENDRELLGYSLT